MILLFSVIDFTYPEKLLAEIVRTRGNGVLFQHGSGNKCNCDGEISYSRSGIHQTEAHRSFTRNLYY